MSKKLIHVVGAVFEREGKIMAAQRGPGRALEGFWEFPGGKIEPGEAPEETLARELREELLTDAEVGPSLPGPSLIMISVRFGWMRISVRLLARNQR